MNASSHHRLTAVLLSVMLQAAIVRAQAPGSAPAAPPSPAPVAAQVTLAVNNQRDTKDIELVGREGNKVFYRLQGGPREASLTLPLASVEEVRFAMNPDQAALARAILTEDWVAVVSILHPVVSPLLPYIDLKENNAVDDALRLGTSIMKAARLSRAKGTESNKVTRAYNEARRVLTTVSKATWFPAAETASLRATQCLIENGEIAQAERELKAAREPEIGDAAYGLYWLVQANLLLARNSIPAAMDAAIKSVAFENKDIETFPDALMMTARCYEEALEMHRARDVYYEVARLFSKTQWETIARQRLQSIMDRGLTRGKETSAIENVFFGLDEDVNSKADALLKGAAAEITGPVTQASVVEAAAAESGNDKGPSNAAGPAPNQPMPRTKGPSGTTDKDKP